MNTNNTANIMLPRETGVCPACGYCPHCGRSGYHTYPYWPPYQPFRYDWPIYTITFTNGTLP